MGGFNRRKYAVYKNQPGGSEYLDPDTCAVIRRDDLLGTTILWQYVIAARGLLEFAKMPGKEGALTDREREALEVRAEGFAELAAEWGENRHAEIPGT